MLHPPPTPEVPQVFPPEVGPLLAAGATLIDIRESDEWREARIPGASFHPLSEINQWYETLPEDRPVILYCRSGQRSAMATQALIHQAGFDNVLNLSGGIVAWAEAGLDIDTDPPPAADQPPGVNEPPPPPGRPPA